MSTLKEAYCKALCKLNLKSSISLFRLPDTSRQWFALEPMYTAFRNIQRCLIDTTGILAFEASINMMQCCQQRPDPDQDNLAKLVYYAVSIRCTTALNGNNAENSVSQFYFENWEEDKIIHKRLLRPGIGSTTNCATYICANENKWLFLKLYCPMNSWSRTLPL